MSEREIGRVRSVSLGFEPDHQTFGFFIELDFGSTGQGYGWFCMAFPTSVMEDPERPESSFHWTDEVLGKSFRKLIKLHEFLQVDELKQAVGKYIEVERDEPYGLIKRLHRLPVDGGATFTMEDIKEGL